MSDVDRVSVLSWMELNLLSDIKYTGYLVIGSVGLIEIEILGIITELLGLVLFCLDTIRFLPMVVTYCKPSHGCLLFSTRSNSRYLLSLSCRKILSSDKLESTTISAQQEEMERKQRLQEQRERLLQQQKEAEEQGRSELQSLLEGQSRFLTCIFCCNQMYFTRIGIIIIINNRDIQNVKITI